jgi:putative FmdB family regulatory protein
MPIYEYECPKHGRYEVSQRITAEALKTCTMESCNEPVRKLISTTSFALKGGGWYATDYASSGKSSVAAKPEATTETKPETKSELQSAGGCGKPACGTGACAGVAQA